MWLVPRAQPLPLDGRTGREEKQGPELPGVKQEGLKPDHFMKKVLSHIKLKSTVI